MAANAPLCDGASSSPMNCILNNGSYKFSPLSGLRRSHIGKRQPAHRTNRANCCGSRFYPVCLLIVAAVLLSGCAFSDEEVLAGRAERQKLEKAYQQVQEALTRQTAVNQELEGKLARLQLLLLEKEAQSKELNKKIEEAILEVVRAKAKLRSLESKRPPFREYDPRPRRLSLTRLQEAGR